MQSISIQPQLNLLYKEYLSLMQKPPLKITHLSTADNIGGSGRSAYKIHRGLLKLGHDSRMLVSMRITDDPRVKYVAGSKLLQKADKALGRTIDATGLQNFGYFASLTLPWRSAIRQADVVQFYNLHHYYINQFMPALLGRKPIVWRLSDQWAFTGHCAYSYACERWKIGCGSCPALEEYDPLTWDTSAFLWRVKKSIYTKLNMTVVAPSRWMQRQAIASPILGGHPVEYIPNGIDTGVYRPGAKLKIREELGIPGDRVVILFSAHGLGSERKGGAHIKEAIRALSPETKRRCFLLLVGEGQPADFQELGIELKIVKEYKDETRLASFYQASDVGIFPSRAENLPNTVLEAMACGVACLSFDIGGITDAIVNGENGFLSPPGDTGKLREALVSLIDDNGLRRKFGEKSVEMVNASFTLEKQAASFEKLYYEILEKEKSRCVG